MAARRTTGALAAGVLLLLGPAACDRPGPLGAVERAPPAAPAWTAPLAGRPLTALFPNAASCQGYVDGPAERFRGAETFSGWAWSDTRKRAVARLAVVDRAGAMVGFGEGGLTRTDVPSSRPEVFSPTTGWQVVVPRGAEPYVVYGVDLETRSACRIGEAKR
jgi:hypothetical protein